MMDIVTPEQRTDDWFRARAGLATASRFRDIIGKRKDGKGYLSARAEYAMQLACERLTGQPVQKLDTAAMAWGRDQEALAAEQYAARTGAQVEQTGFVRHVTLEAGCSPDGLVDWDGLIEIKCPFNPINHVETLEGGLPDEHIAQIQGQIWVTGRTWCDFVSFDPRMPPRLQMYVERVYRDEGFILNLEAEIASFLGEVSAMVERIQRIA